MGHVVIGTSVCLRFCFLLTLTGLVIIWTSGKCVYQFTALLALTGTTWICIGSVLLGGGGGEGRGEGMGRGGLSKCQNLVREEGILKRHRLRQPKR